MADRLEKLEVAVKKLAADMSQVRGDVGELREEMGELREDMGDIKKGVFEIQRTQGALTDAMTKAIKSLGMSKTLEIRVDRLESAVFGAKH